METTNLKETGGEVQSEQRQYAVTDGTVVNPAAGQASKAWKYAGAGKRWAARVWRDQSEPGGLRRSFLKTREDGEIVLIRDVKAGEVIEFAEKWPTYKPNPDANLRIYVLAKEINAGALIGEIVEKTSIKKWVEEKQERDAAEAAKKEAYQAQRAQWKAEAAEHRASQEKRIAQLRARREMAKQPPI